MSVEKTNQNSTLNQTAGEIIEQAMTEFKALVEQTVKSHGAWIESGKTSDIL